MAEDSRPRSSGSEQQETERKREQENDKQKEAENDKQKDPEESDKQNDGSATARSDGRSRQREYFREELRRLKTSLDKEAAKMKAPEKKEHVPYVFNSLKPYYDTRTPRALLDSPEETRHSYMVRRTATGLCDPWIDHQMDRDALPRIEPKTASQDDGSKRSKKKKGSPREKEGSTRLPVFPAVNIPASDLQRRKLYFSDVPMLRDELRKRYLENEDGRVKKDYNRTKADFYRMELDKMDEYHPLSRPSMRSAYFAYLQNTRGSRLALYDCIKELEKKEEEEEKKEQEEKRKREEKEQEEEKERSAARSETPREHRQSEVSAA